MITGLAHEKTLPHGRERHFHETMAWFNDALFAGVGTCGITKAIVTEDVDMDDANDIEANFERRFNESMKAQEKGKEPVSDCIPSNITWVLTSYC